MPHAVEDVTMGDADEESATARYMDQNGGIEGAASEFLNREIDQRDKAADAVDYEDISDLDDLPDEEEAAHQLEDDDATSFLGGADNGDAHTNGHDESKEPSSDDMFGYEGTNDLFGEHTSSPEQARQPVEHVSPQPQRRPGGLALPGKSGLALPKLNAAPTHTRHVPRPPPRQPEEPASSLSPPSLYSGDYSPAASPGIASDGEDLAGLDEATILQRRLMGLSRRRQAGETVEEESREVDPDEFYTFFPSYEKDQNPRFIEYFPQRPVKYRGKVPAKPPKALVPTKLSLDLLPDQERSFRGSTVVGRIAQEASYQSNLVTLNQATAVDDDSDNDLAFSVADDTEALAGVTMADLAMICEDWDMPDVDIISAADERDEPIGAEWDAEEYERPIKRRKIDALVPDVFTSLYDAPMDFEDPERAAAKFAKRVTLDLNDANLLVDEHAPQTARRAKRIPGDIRRDPAQARDLARRYNISNDEAYDLLKENHQHKVRSTLGNAAVEHSLPATKLQYPFYKVSLDPKSKRSFHRPALHLKDWETKPQKDFRVVKLKTIKRKERRGREVKDLFATAESLAFNDNSNMLLLEYSEEAPAMLSNFGMGNRLVNFYRKRNADDQERPKRDIGETQVLLTQDKSPFGNFGHVDQGEVVPTMQNGLFRSPIFQHQAKPTDFFVAISSTHEYGSRMYMRNVENLHTVGQQFPVAEVPGEHSRRVTDAAKKRLRALAYRIYTKVQDGSRRDKVLDNQTLMKRLKNHDMPQTRSKMREFMKYDKDRGVWNLLPGQVVPDGETLRSWVKPEDVSLLDSMQVGVQRLADLGLTVGEKDEEDKDIDENSNIELQLAPWQSTKSFIQATQGKAMLKLHGEGDPTGRGEGFSFVKTSMKGGFQAIGESVEDKIDAKRRRENGGHTYNVAKQQKAYDDYIRMIWDKQKNSLASNMELSDVEMDDDADAEPEGAYGRVGTPRSSFAGTPIGNNRRGGDDETGTQFSKASADRGNGRVLIIKRTGGRDAYGQEADGIEKITNPKVVREYLKRKSAAKLATVGENINDYVMYTPTGEDPELDELVKLAILGERTRIERNKERREARERLKGKAAGIGGGGASGAAGSPPASVAGSPGAGGGGGGGVSDQGSPAASSVAFGGGVGSASGTPVKGGRGGGGRRSKDGTARKCAECGQVGHIKTNRKSVLPPFLCSVCGGEEEEEGVDGGELVGKGAGDRGGKERSVGEVRSERRREKIKRAKGAFAGDTVSGLVL
ncbi:hypothetical protein LTR91_004239 [Friedmanniomyces endolithicus]|uniref:Transcription initiation factor TFIID subunit 1 histone acetyltransferase domain-containing protein n=1 Tax=Friedmanniomyces endolithicus TaxID=329885 RepID=A0AAN6QY13_9PEZI|nr:hypothetical protein LTR94_013571 [Friedmanniomyces endolithicus]KAK0778970.1 hypothetical protein LTR59_013332 [Friedmanniomyces endolithicus]KAK0786295.1 hypothetical protein LTR38_012040 [Friedmanniomyces endolithicus]KAK0814596.1 hypothetical protein LTR75_004108 [Friedmanniomyces endolithicus]KAK0855244.1 hypothetical protein LTR03_002010 [Friedmanniomyces endolithicus]